MVDEGWQLTKLGWRSFQDLVMAILDSTFGQTVEPFEDGKDAGRDGAFHGTWVDTAASQSLSGRFVIQAKHSSLDRTLSLTDIKPELEKIKKLRKRNLCDNYILVTNCRVTAEASANIVTAIEATGVQQARVWARSWVENRLSSSTHLRQLVPRVYGLGDLGEILDDRSRKQATAILSSLGSTSATFVATAPYYQAKEALKSHHAVMLLGGPTVGKSVIAQMLALGAIDAGGLTVIKATSSADFMDTWNPEVDNRLFWVDDVFGELEADPALVTSWARRMSAMHAAGALGNKFVFTSRDYIFQDAVQRLKEENISFWNNSRIDVSVETLTPAERTLILYNHIKLGDQTTTFKRSIKRHLPEVVNLDSFTPGLAFRLGHKRFTEALDPGDEAAVFDFFDHPSAYLDNIVRELGKPERAALATIFAYGGALEMPMQNLARADLVMGDLGAETESLHSSLRSLTGTFVKALGTASGTEYTFAHPTIREATNRYLQNNLASASSIIRATPIEDLVAQIDFRPAGDLIASERGRRLHLDSIHASEITSAILAYLDANQGRYAAWDFKSNTLDLLSRRADPEIRSMFVQRGGAVLNEWTERIEWHSATQNLFELLDREGSLPEAVRMAAVQHVSTPAAQLRSWVWNTQNWVKEIERKDIEKSVLRSLNDPTATLDTLRKSYDYSSDPEGYMEDYWSTLEEMKEHFSTPEHLHAVREYEFQLEATDREIHNITEHGNTDEYFAEPPARQTTSSHVGDADIFADVDE